MAATPNLLSQGAVAAGNVLNTNGGVAVFAKTATVAYTDATAKDLFSLPAGAVPIDVLVDVTTLFNDSGTDLLEVGKTGATTHFFGSLDVSSTGRKTPTRTNLGVSVGTSPITVQAKFTGQNANANQGAAVVTVLYIMP